MIFSSKYLLPYNHSHLLQEEPNNTRKHQFGGSTKDKFFDDFEVVDKEEVCIA